MSTPAALPHDQAAVISLLLRRRRSYADVARVLVIDERAVIRRARAAVVALAPQETAPTSPAEREVLADYLLGQLSGSAAAAALQLLEDSRAARVWARRAAAGLDALAPGEVPPVPAGTSPAGRPAGASTTEDGRAGATSGPAEPATASGRRDTTSAPAEPRAPSSRLGGAILLVAMAALLALAIVLVTRSGEGGGQGVVTGPGTDTVASAATGSSTFRVLSSSALTAGSAGTGARGVAEMVSAGGQRAIAVAGQGVAPTAGLSRSGFDYTLWLSGQAGVKELGVAPAVGRDGRLQALGALPAGVSGYRTVLVTRETTQTPASPGPVVLSGPLPGA